mgnify:CR=1 FL=1
MTSSVHSLDVAAFRDNADAILTAATQGDARVPGVVAMVTDRDGNVYEGAAGVRNIAEPAEMTLSLIHISEPTRPY